MLEKTGGFTLAEVLITLAIIGVVAAMTLPTLITSGRNKQLESALKKEYSIVAQALDLYNADYGIRLTSENAAGWGVKDIIIKYFKILKDCGYGSEDTSEALEKVCIPNYVNTGSTENNSTNYKTLNGKSNIDLKYFDDGQFVLVDGSLVLLENKSGGQLFISVDVNGYNKRPNRLGQDLFMFEINEKGALLPMGAKGTHYYSDNDEYCSLGSSNNMNGAGCTYKALNEKDYFNKLPK